MMIQKNYRCVEIVKKYVHILAKNKFDVDRVKSKQSEIKLKRDFSDEN